MKKIFEIIGFVSLACFCLFYTREVAVVIKSNDDILKHINSIKDQYEISSINAIIDDDTIIPGVSGTTIDVDRSYKKMKQLDNFNFNLLVYEKIKPEVSIKNIYDKYIISGNEKRNKVSLIFLLYDNEDISKTLKILNDNGVKGNFFVTVSWFDNNNDLISDLINQKHIIGMMYTDTKSIKGDITWINSVTTKVNNQSSGYCYNKEKNTQFLDICKLNTSYTIIPNIEAYENPLINVKNNISNGSIIEFKINEDTIEQLELIIKYINSRGLEIVNLESLLEE